MYLARPAKGYRGLGVDQAFDRGLFGLVSRRDPKHLAHHTPWALLAEGVVIQFPKAKYFAILEL